MLNFKSPMDQNDMDLKVCCLALKDTVWINTAAASGEGNQLSTCNPSGLQQHHLFRLCHPSINYTLRLAVKTSRCPSEGLYISLNKFCDQVNHIFEGCHYNEGIPVEVTVTIDIFVKVPIIFEGIPGRDNYTDGHQDGCG